MEVITGQLVNYTSDMSLDDYISLVNKIDKESLHVFIQEIFKEIDTIEVVMNLKE